MILWSLASQDEKHSRVDGLHRLREKLLQESRQKRARKSSSRRGRVKVKEVIKFKSAELEELFHKLPKDAKEKARNSSAFVVGGAD